MENHSNLTLVGYYIKGNLVKFGNSDKVLNLIHLPVAPPRATLGHFKQAVMKIECSKPYKIRYYCQAFSKNTPVKIELTANDQNLVLDENNHVKLWVVYEEIDESTQKDQMMLNLQTQPRNTEMNLLKHVLMKNYIQGANFS